ncbi:winged helix-turn-helix transcriptional regulator [Fodinicola acaciae]|uniref:winged helix-turn-helix transcriptional regulator n=1 Tax=Fodinicola acaciae TaxID=2681555 RepID=UPI001FE9EA61|nr:helix-turn-helix domain-containing protein [Fodinicola acaciae]
MPTDHPACSIERTLEVVGERWTFLILRELFGGTHRFADLRAKLGIAPNLLSTRLKTLTAAGLVEQHSYQEPGSRTRESYHLTATGRQLRLVLAALQQWGDENRPRPSGPTCVRRSRRTNRPVRVALLDSAGREVALDDLDFVRTDQASISTVSWGRRVR